MTKSTKRFTENSDAVSDVIGELLMTAVAFLAFGVIAVFVLSFQGTTMPHVDIDGWVDVNDDSVYIRHSGGNTVDTSYIRIILNLNGTRKELSPDDVYAILKSSTWGLGDTIVINTSQLWSITISEDDYVDVTIVHTGHNIVMFKGVLLGEVIEMTATPTPTPTPTPTSTPTPTPTPTPSGETFTPASVYDTSGGEATVGQVQTDGDSLYTTYKIPKQSTYDETAYQQFNFTPGLTTSLTRVLVRINHTEANANADKVKIEVWEQDVSAWHDETIPKITTWTLDEVDVSSYIDTQDDINNLKVRYLAHTNAANKNSNIEYVAVYVE